jgi:hypothetical protein
MFSIQGSCVLCSDALPPREAMWQRGRIVSQIGPRKRLGRAPEAHG